MDDELTPKQEHFAQIYVETSNASEAYRQAYDVGENTKPESVWQEACRTLADPKVTSRVGELQKTMQGRHNVTVDRLARELEEARTWSMADPKGASAAVSAVMGKAKLYGLLVDKSELSGPNGSPVEVKQLSDLDLARRVAFALSKGLKEMKAKELTKPKSERDETLFKDDPNFTGWTGQYEGVSEE